MSKGKAFILCLMAIMAIFAGMFILVLARKADISLVPVAASLTAVCSLAGLYIGGSVANNGVKGHNWNQQMFDSENEEVKK